MTTHTHTNTHTHANVMLVSGYSSVERETEKEKAGERESKNVMSRLRAIHAVRCDMTLT